MKAVRTVGGPVLRTVRTTVLAPLLVALAIGCGRGRGGAGGDPGEAKTLIPVLHPLSLAAQSAYPQDELQLRVVASKSAGQQIETAADLKPAAGEVITWALVGSGSAGASLSQTNSLTAVDGTAGVTVHVGTDSPVSFQVLATLTGADPVSFSVQVRNDQRELQLLAGVPDATGAQVDAATDGSTRLRVRLVRPVSPGPDVPVSGQRVRVELLGGPRNGARLADGSGGTLDITTDLNGMASVRFLTGSTAPAAYEVEVCGDGSCGAQAKQFTVRVAARGATSSGCLYYTDCEPGHVCDAGECKLAAAYCDVDADCPVGHRCSASRTCEVQAGVPCSGVGDCGIGELCSTTSETCIPEEGCTTAGDCAERWTCDYESGACLPPSNEPAIDVRGEWLTRYHFDISDALPGFFDGMAPVVDFLDLVFRNQLDIDVPIIGDVLEGFLQQLVNQYVPPWVVTVTTVLGDLIHLFENVEAQGELLLLQYPDAPVLGANISGEESWTSALFFVASLCPGGIQQFEQDPTCGQIDVVLTPTVGISASNNDPTVGVRVDPFNGQVQGATLWLFDREVEIELRQLVNVLLDIIVTAASNGQWYDFETFLLDVIPCTELQYALDDLVYDLTDGRVATVPGVELACLGAANYAVNSMTDALAEIGVGMELDFDARVAIHDLSAPADGVAEVLGAPTAADDSTESALIGDIDATWVFGGDLDRNSWWYATR